jgi:hypothetical protein
LLTIPAAGAIGAATYLMLVLAGAD